jgi:hypothetical protein
MVAASARHVYALIVRQWPEGGMFEAARKMLIAATTGAALLCAGFSVAEELKELKPEQRLSGAQRLAALLPEARAGWRTGRPRTSWRRSRIEATRRYRATEGFDSFMIRYETHSRSLLYKFDLLRDAKQAKRRGYTVKKFQGMLALVRDLGHKREIRIWPNKYVLVMAVGSAKLEEIESHLKIVKFKQVSRVHFGPKARRKRK